MPAKAIVPGEAIPGIQRFRGHGPLSYRAMGPSYSGGGCATDLGNGRCLCRSGPCPRRRLFRLGRFLASIAFAAMGRSYKAMGPSYSGGGCATDLGNGRCVCRSGPCARRRLFRLGRFLASIAFAAMGRSYRAMGRSYKAMGPSYGGGGCAADLGNGRCLCRSGPCPRERLFRVRRFLASNAFAAMGRSFKAMGCSYQAMGPSYSGGGCATDLGNGRWLCRSGPCPRERLFRVRRFLASNAVAAMGRSYKAMGPSYRGMPPPPTSRSPRIVPRAPAAAGRACESAISHRCASSHPRIARHTPGASVRAPRRGFRPASAAAGGPGSWRSARRSGLPTRLAPRLRDGGYERLQDRARPEMHLGRHEHPGDHR